MSPMQPALPERFGSVRQAACALPSLSESLLSHPWWYSTNIFLILPNLSWAADDGAAIYKAKCTACHGADLAGKPAAKIPSLVSDDAKKASDADLTDAIANGGKEKEAMHAFANKGVTPDHVKATVSYIRGLQNK